MKTIRIITISLLLMATLASAQDTMYVYKTGSMVTRCAVSDIDSIVFKSSLVKIQIPVLTTTSASNITQNTATSGGKVTSDGGATVSACGICWSTISNPTTALNTKTREAGTTGSFTSSITGLSANTTYYFRAYATNSAGTAYGNELIFITKAIDTGFGGIITQYTSNGVNYAVHTFTYDAKFYPPANLTHARVLLVGAGGNGGGVAWDVGGGGGGGEVKEMDVVITGSTMPVTISTGGSSSTSFGGQTAINGSAGAGGAGGNGGTSGSGKNGGVGQSRAGGGGGGGSYGFDGVKDNWNPMGGNGGDGSMTDISGVSTYYGGGGGGGTWTGWNGSTGKGGLGGGGGAWGANGVVNTGGGGTGACYSSGGGSSNYVLGGSGGSGIVIISYPL
jgi:hypothetical protein